jgi:hypothetical protein
VRGLDHRGECFQGSGEPGLGCRLPGGPGGEEDAADASQAADHVVGGPPGVGVSGAAALGEVSSDALRLP